MGRHLGGHLGFEEKEAGSFGHLGFEEKEAGSFGHLGFEEKEAGSFGVIWGLKRKKRAHLGSFGV